MMTQLLAHLWGDYIFQSDWMAQNKTKRSWPAFVHALLYSLCFVWLCWVPSQLIQHPRACVTFIDKSGGETTCADANSQVPDGAVGWRLYTNPTSQLIPAHFRWLAWLVIFGTHFLIDRYKMARYVVWAKNWMGPKKKWFRKIGGGIPCWTDAVAENPDAVFLPDGYNAVYAPVPPLWACPTGYPPSTPAWLSTWLLIITDNTLHLTINYFALRYL